MGSEERHRTPWGRRSVRLPQVDGVPHLPVHISNGYPPPYFFTNAYDKTLKAYNAKLEKAVADDIGNAINTLLNGGTV